jgi:protein-(glutamine-N5) methyltransferase, release factor-specific
MVSVRYQVQNVQVLDNHGCTVVDVLREAEHALATQHDTACLDAEVLLAHVLCKDRAYLHAWPDKILAPDVLRRFETLVSRRVAGEPIAYITGQQEFWSLVLAVSAHTLIPRPETELLVDLALRKRPLHRAVRLADLGTGAGTIALAIASERHGWQVVATDLSPQALTVARENAHRFALGNIEFHAGDWCSALPYGWFDIIVSNPPYVPDHDPHLIRGDVRFEPRMALAGGPDGLTAIRAIAAQAKQYLAPGGWLLLEHGFDQGPTVTDLLKCLGYERVSDHRDQRGYRRICEGCWAAPRMLLLPRAGGDKRRP